MKGRKGSRFLNRKGNTIVTVFVVTLLIVMFLVMAVIGVQLKNVFNIVEDELVDNFDPVEDNISITIMQDSNESYGTSMDTFIFIFFIAVYIGLLIMTYYAQDHPLVFILLLLAMIAILTVSGYVSNVWEDFADNEGNVDAIQDFPMTNWLGSNLMLVILGVLISVGIVFFVREQG